MKLTGALAIVEALHKEKITTIFGIPGGVVIPLFDALYGDKKINMVITKHEQGAIHAADGFARSSGKPGVCIVTSGPGATNIVTGLATAYMDSIPVVAITGQVPTAIIGNDAFQEADTTGITRPVTKHNFIVKDPNELTSVLKKAFHIAKTGRPGPVVVDIPKDITTSEFEFDYPEKVSIPGYNPTVHGHTRQIKKVMDAIKEAKRPLIYAGGGIISSDASSELKQFVKTTGTPVTLTLMGLGAYPGTEPEFLGMLGMHGTKTANYAVDRCDLLIAIGARFDDRVTGKLEMFAPHAKFIHIDIDPASIGKNVVIDIPIVGDAKNILKEMNKHAVKLDIKNWQNEVSKWKKEHPLAFMDDELLRPQYIIDQLYKITKGDAIITTEVGQNQMWTAQFYKFDKPRRLITSGGLGTMGYGLPAAIGAQFANPDSTVIDIAGDGSIQMNIQEMATISQCMLPIKIVLLNNGYLGMVRQWQEFFFNKRYSATCLKRTKGCPDICSNPGPQCPQYVPDFVKLAEAYNAVGIRITKKSDVQGALRDAISTDKAVLLDFIINPEENVTPMVPAGAPINKMISSKEDAEAFLLA
ncbi:MAG: biosynthetic-type acetolactate synthase large subunit [Spirochaetota bacterium]|nr:MAG: biosynthetic-type acetolactate synthase large subunit [Spirochaetota bacterium]